MKDRGLFLGYEFQPAVRYRDPARAPFNVATQTANIIDNLYYDAYPNTGHAQQYLLGYTEPYLEAAEKGYHVVFEGRSPKSVSEEPEFVEALGHALVVVAHVPKVNFVDSITRMLSKRQNLRPPRTREEFLDRIRELQDQVGEIAYGHSHPRDMLFLRPPLLRTMAFFKVAKELPRIKMQEEEKITIKRLLEGVNF